MPLSLKGYILHILIAFMLFSVAFDCYAQKEQNNNITIRASCTVPHPVSNGAFRKSLTGIYDANFSVNAKLFPGFYVGVVYKNGLFTTAANKIAEVNTSLQVNNVGGRLTYDHFISDVTFFSSSLNAGQHFGKYTGVICRDPQEVNKSYKASYIEPEFNLYFIVDPNFAIGINLSTTFINHTFDPYAVCFNQYKGYTDSELSGNSASVNFGFGFYYGFWGGAKRQD